VANPLGIFFSRLAPEDRRFIKRIGIFLIFLLIVSGAALFLYTYYSEHPEIEIPFLLRPSHPADSASKGFELPPAPELPDFADSIKLPPAPETPKVSQTEAEVSFDDDFDEQAHLQLMRQNANQYNYTMAYKHGARITGYLFTNPGLTAEWGHILLEAGKPKDAISVLQKAFSKDSANSKIAIDMAFAMFRSGDANGAIEFLDSAIASNNDLNLLVAKATITGEYPDTTKRAAAEQIFKTVLKKNSSLPDANYQYGRFLMQKGDYRNSKTYLELAIKAKPNEPRYIARLGMSEFYLKQDSNAETLYQKALQINPYDYNTWFNLGELYLSVANESVSSTEVRQKTHKALESYLKAVENDSSHAGAHYRVGLILNGNADYRGAIRHLTVALEKIPNSIPVMQQLSSAHLQFGDTVKSVDYLEKILQLDPFDRIAANELNRIRELQK
jgi:tetratricopeptide (TPR) repeat protein